MERLLRSGGVKLDDKSALRRVVLFIEGACRSVLAGVSMEDLPFSFIAALVYTAALVSVFSALLWSTLQNNMSNAFLSLDPKAGDCGPVSKNISGTFLADYNGYWQMNPRYEESKSLFVYTMTGLNVDEESYRKSINHIFDGLQSFQKRSSSRPYFWNMMLLNMVTINHAESGTGMTLQTDAVFSFNTQVNVAAFSNRKGVCVGDKNGNYLSGTFNEAQAALQLTIPFTVNRSSVFGDAINSDFQITYTPQKIEPCPLHGNWANSTFPQATAQFRDGQGSLSFDVRSTLMAITLNLNLLPMGVGVLTSSELLRDLGFIALQDPFYVFPTMQRIYCVDKRQPVWGDRFLQEEKDEFSAYVYGTAKDPSKSMKYPPICFIDSAKKNVGLQLFYPIINQLKTDRCVDNPEGCPSRTSFSMSQCSCTPDKNGNNDARNSDCNRQSIWLGYLYQTLVDPIDRKNTSGQLRNDAAIKFGLDQQREVMKLQKDFPKDYEMQFIGKFTSIFKSTVAVLKNVDYSTKGTQVLGDLTSAWDSLNSTSTRLSAVIFRSLGIEGQINFILPINKFAVQMVDLVTVSDPSNKRTFYDPTTGFNLTAVMCRDAFNYATALNRLRKTPPAQLVEGYYKCKRTLQSSLVVSIGSSASTTNLIMTSFWAFAGALVVWCYKKYLKLNGKKEVIVSLRTKNKLNLVLQDVKDECLSEAVGTLLERCRAQEELIRALERRVTGGSSATMSDESTSSKLASVRGKFDSVFGGQDVQLARIVSAHANELTRIEELQFRGHQVENHKFKPRASVYARRASLNAFSPSPLHGDDQSIHPSFASIFATEDEPKLATRASFTQQQPRRSSLSPDQAEQRRSFSSFPTPPFPDSTLRRPSLVNIFPPPPLQREGLQLSPLSAPVPPAARRVSVANYPPAMATAMSRLPPPQPGDRRHSFGQSGKNSL